MEAIVVDVLNSKLVILLELPGALAATKLPDEWPVGAPVFKLLS